MKIIKYYNIIIRINSKLAKFKSMQIKLFYRKSEKNNIIIIIPEKTKENIIIQKIRNIV